MQTLGHFDRARWSERIGQRDEHFVDRLPLDVCGFAAEELVNPLRGGETFVDGAVEEHAVGTPHRGLGERHADADPAFARFPRCRRNHATTTGPPTDDERPAGELWMALPLDGDEERIDVEVQNQ